MAQSMPKTGTVSEPLRLSESRPDPPVAFWAYVSRGLAFWVRRSPRALRHWRLELLSVRLSQHLRGRLDETAVRTHEGFRLRVDGQSQVGRVVYATGRYEDGVAAVFKRLLRPGDTFVDGGAHIGFFTILGARLVGSRGTVVAFEPSSATRKTLSANVALNRSGNVIVRPEALGSVAARSELSHPLSAQTGQATLRQASASVGQEAVDVIALDSLFDEVGRIDVVKLDLEGFELEALKGMSRILGAHHPSLVVEVTDEFLRASHDGSAVALFRFLTGLGYAACLIGDHEVTPIHSIDDWIRLPTQFNALFLARADARAAFALTTPEKKRVTS
jgi:FkbM family methyltransferase